MPGYVIHLAVGKIYEQNNKINNLNDFERGIIEPDISKNKVKSHFGPYSSQPGLNKFLKINGISNSYDEGYFLHLVTDYLFYNRFLDKWDTIIYDDYDRLNSRLIKKYKIVIPEDIQNKVKFKNGQTIVLNEEQVYKFINSVGKIDIRQLILQKGNYCEKLINRIRTRYIIKRRKIKK